MRVVVSGGGTGGHIYPALALLQQMRAENLIDAELFVGTERGLEARIVPAQGVDFATVQIQGFSRKMNFKGLRTNLKTVQLFMKSVGQAKKILLEFKPDVVVGTGGYASSATLFAASRLHIPTVIHESNSVAGVTNKFLGKFVNKVAISFPEVAIAFPKQKVVMTGNPRAQQVAGLTRNDQLAQFDLDPKKRTLLIFGGSRGAPRLNKAVLAAIPSLAAGDYQTIFVTGRVHYDKVVASAGALPANVVIVPYVDHMEQILPDIDLLVGRSGATTLAEMTALGLPAVLVPSPNVTHNHQYMNAASLAKVGAAKVVTEDKLDTDFVQVVTELMNDPAGLATMAAASKTLGVPDATDRLIATIISATKGE